MDGAVRGSEQNSGLRVLQAWHILAVGCQAGHSTFLNISVYKTEIQSLHFRIIVKI